MISQEDGSKLLKLVRESVSLYFENKTPEDSYLKEKFSKKQGCFVTITKKKRLRGCIGFPEPIIPLYKAIIQAARSAAFEDSRFQPLQKEELNEIEFEISILTIPELIKVKNPEMYLKKIKIGEDGLIIRGISSGLLLPQVFTEYKCDSKKALEMTCNKAGLPQDAWQDLNNKIYRFQAQIFSESKNL